MDNSNEAIQRALGISLDENNGAGGDYRSTLSALFERSVTLEARDRAISDFNRQVEREAVRQQRAAETEARRIQREQEREAARLQRERDRELTRQREEQAERREAINRQMQIQGRQIEDRTFTNLSDRDRSTLFDANDASVTLRQEQLAAENTARAQRAFDAAESDAEIERSTIRLQAAQQLQAVAEQRRVQSVSPEDANALIPTLDNETSGPGTFLRDLAGATIGSAGDLSQLAGAPRVVGDLANQAADFVSRDTLSERAANVRGQNRATFDERREAGQGRIRAGAGLALDTITDQNRGSIGQLLADTGAAVAVGRGITGGARIAARAPTAPRGQPRPAPTTPIGRAAQSFDDAAGTTLLAAGGSEFVDNRAALEAELGRELTGAEAAQLRATTLANTGVQTLGVAGLARINPALRAIGAAPRAGGATSIAGALGGGTLAEAIQEGSQDIGAQISANIVNPNRTALEDLDAGRTIEASALGGLLGLGTAAGRPLTDRTLFGRDGSQGGDTDSGAGSPPTDGGGNNGGGNGSNGDGNPGTNPSGGNNNGGLSSAEVQAREARRQQIIADTERQILARRDPIALEAERERLDRLLAGVVDDSELDRLDPDREGLFRSADITPAPVPAAERGRRQQEMARRRQDIIDRSGPAPVDPVDQVRLDAITTEQNQRARDLVTPSDLTAAGGDPDLAFEQRAQRIQDNVSAEARRENLRQSELAVNPNTNPFDNTEAGRATDLLSQGFGTPPAPQAPQSPQTFTDPGTPVGATGQAVNLLSQAAPAAQPQQQRLLTGPDQTQRALPAPGQTVGVPGPNPGAPIGEAGRAVDLLSQAAPPQQQQLPVDDGPTQTSEGGRFRPFPATPETQRAIDLQTRTTTGNVEDSNLGVDEFENTATAPDFDQQILESGVIQPSTEGGVPQIPSGFETGPGTGSGARTRTVLSTVIDRAARTDNPITGDEAQQTRTILNRFSSTRFNPQFLESAIRSYAVDRGDNVATSDNQLQIDFDAVQEDPQNQIVSRFNRKLVRGLRSLAETGGQTVQRRDGSPLLEPITSEDGTVTGVRINVSPIEDGIESPLQGVQFVDANTQVEEQTEADGEGLGVPDDFVPQTFTDPGTPVGEAARAVELQNQPVNPDSQAPAPQLFEDPGRPIGEAGRAVDLVNDSANQAATIRTERVNPDGTPIGDTDSDANLDENVENAAENVGRIIRGQVGLAPAQIPDAQIPTALRRSSELIELTRRVGGVYRPPFARDNAPERFSPEADQVATDLDALNTEAIRNIGEEANARTNGRLDGIRTIDLSNQDTIEQLRDASEDVLDSLHLRRIGDDFFIDSARPAAGAFNRASRTVIVDPKVTLTQRGVSVNGQPRSEQERAAYILGLTAIHHELGHALEQDIHTLPENLWSDVRAGFTAFLSAPVEERAAQFGLSVEAFSRLPQWYQDSFGEWNANMLGRELERQQVNSAQARVNDPTLSGRLRSLFQSLADLFRQRFEQIVATNRNANVREVSYADVVEYWRSTPRETAPNLGPADAEGPTSIDGTDPTGTQDSNASNPSPPSGDNQAGSPTVRDPATGITGQADVPVPDGPLTVRRIGPRDTSGTRNGLNGDGSAATARYGVFDQNNNQVGVARRQGRANWEATTFQGRPITGGATTRLLNELRRNLRDRPSEARRVANEAGTEQTNTEGTGQAPIPNLNDAVENINTVLRNRGIDPNDTAQLTPVQLAQSVQIARTDGLDSATDYLNGLLDDANSQDTSGVDQATAKKSFLTEAGQLLSEQRAESVNLRPDSDGIDVVAEGQKRLGDLGKAYTGNTDIIRRGEEPTPELRALAEGRGLNLDNEIVSMYQDENGQRLVINTNALPDIDPDLAFDAAMIEVLTKAGVYAGQVERVVRGIVRTGTNNIQDFASGGINATQTQRSLMEAQRRINTDELAAPRQDFTLSPDFKKFAEVARWFADTMGDSEIGNMILTSMTVADTIRLIGGLTADGIAERDGVTWNTAGFSDIEATTGPNSSLDRTVIDNITNADFGPDVSYSFAGSVSGKTDGDLSADGTYYSGIGGGGGLLNRVYRAARQLRHTEPAELLEAAMILGTKTVDMPLTAVRKIDEAAKDQGVTNLVRSLNSRTKGQLHRIGSSKSSLLNQYIRRAANFLRPLQLVSRDLIDSARGYTTEQLQGNVGTALENLLNFRTPDSPYSPLDINDARSKINTLAREFYDATDGGKSKIYDLFDMYNARTRVTTVSNNRLDDEQAEVAADYRQSITELVDAVRAEAGDVNFDERQAETMVNEIHTFKHVLESTHDRVLFNSGIIAKGEKLPEFVRRLPVGEKKVLLEAYYNELRNERNNTETSDDLRRLYRRTLDDSSSSSITPQYRAEAQRLIARGTIPRHIMRDMIMLEVMGTLQPDPNVTTDVSFSLGPDSDAAAQVLMFGSPDQQLPGIMNADIMGITYNDAIARNQEHEARIARNDQIAAALDGVANSLQAIRFSNMERTWQAGITTAATRDRFLRTRQRYQHSFPLDNTAIGTVETDPDADILSEMREDGSIEDLSIEIGRPVNIVNPIEAIQNEWSQSYLRDESNKAKLPVVLNASIGEVLAEDAPEALRELLRDRNGVQTYRIRLYNSRDRDVEIEKLRNRNANFTTFHLPRSTELSGRDDGHTFIIEGTKPKGELDDLVNVVRGNRQRSQAVADLRATKPGQFIGKATSFIGDLHTRKNIQYGLPALFRDHLLGLMTAAGSEGLTGASDYLRNSYDSLRYAPEVFQYMTLRAASRRGDATGAKAQSDLRKLLARRDGVGAYLTSLNEYVTESGGMVSFTAMVQDLQSAQGNVVAPQSRNGASRAVRNGLDNLNRITEVGDILVRHSVYQTYRQRGESVRRAGQRARDTADFEQRGESGLTDWGRFMYTFFNSSMVGAAQITDQAFNAKYNTEIMAASLVLGMAQVPLMALMSGEDEDEGGNLYLNRGDSISHWMIPIPGTEEFIRMPINYNIGGVGALLGTQISRFMLGAQDASELAQNMTGILTSNLSPVNNDIPLPTSIEESLIKPILTVMPSFFEPIVSLGFNTSNFGGDIYDDGTGFQAKGAYAQAYNSTRGQVGSTAEFLARGMAELGAPVIGVRTLNHLLSEYLGGLNQASNVILESTRIVTGGLSDASNLRALPFVGGFIANPQNGLQQRLYKEVERMYKQESNIDTRINQGRTREEAIEDLGYSEADIERNRLVREANNEIRRAFTDIESQTDLNTSGRSVYERRADQQAIVDPIRKRVLDEIDNL